MTEPDLRIKPGDTIVVTGTIPLTNLPVGLRGRVERVWPHARQMAVHWEDGEETYLFTDDDVEPLT